MRFEHSFDSLTAVAAALVTAATAAVTGNAIRQRQVAEPVAYMVGYTTDGSADGAGGELASVKLPMTDSADVGVNARELMVRASVAEANADDLNEDLDQIIVDISKRKSKRRATSVERPQPR